MAERVPGPRPTFPGRANNNGPAPWCGATFFVDQHSEDAFVFDRLCSWENLLAAFRLAARGKRGRPNVAAFEVRLEDQLLELQCQLSDGSYRPGPYASFWIHEPKRRLISAAPFRDRVVHHALCQVIEPGFERSFVAGSFANRRGKGTHRALDLAQRLARRHRYVLQADVRQFFPSLDHASLRAEIARKVLDLRVLGLVDRILASGDGLLGEAYDMVFFPGDDLLAAARPRGLPIGNLTSQFWANVYLNGFDHFVKRDSRCGGYVRYVDDVLLFGDDTRRMWSWRDDVITRLAGLRLTLHSGAHPRPVSEGVPFLGFVVYPDRRRLKRRKGLHFRPRLVRLYRESRNGDRPFTDVSLAVRGWVNHVRYANSIGLRKAILAVSSSFGEADRGDRALSSTLADGPPRSMAQPATRRPKRPRRICTVASQSAENSDHSRPAQPSHHVRATGC